MPILLARGGWNGASLPTARIGSVRDTSRKLSLRRLAPPWRPSKSPQHCLSESASSERSGLPGLHCDLPQHRFAVAGLRSQKVYSERAVSEHGGVVLRPARRKRRTNLTVLLAMPLAGIKPAVIVACFRISLTRDCPGCLG